MLLLPTALLAEGAVPEIRRHYIDLSGGQLHYVTAGSGENLLLLHQAPLSHAEFMDVIPLLARHFRVIAWDAPGHGNSYTPPREYEVPDYLDVLDEFVSALGLERVHMLGHHSGASFTREYVASHPEKAGKIILSGSARTPPDPKTELTRAKEFLQQPYMRELVPGRDGAFLPPSWQRYVTLASRETEADTIMKPFVIALDARSRPYDLHLAIFRYQGWSDYRQVETPVLLIAGAEDFFLNRERMDYTCTLFPNCEVHPLIEGAGAFIGWEQPQAYAEAIIGFLKN
jgi:pimeloyl-ACP methyl ester carboxylesterase